MHTPTLPPTHTRRPANNNMHTMYPDYHLDFRVGGVHYHQSTSLNHGCFLNYINTGGFASIWMGLTVVSDTWKRGFNNPLNLWDWDESVRKDDLMGPKFCKGAGSIQILKTRHVPPGHGPSLGPHSEVHTLTQSAITLSICSTPSFTCVQSRLKILFFIWIWCKMIPTGLMMHGFLSV